MIETNDDNTNGLPINPDVRIENGKLLFEKRWYEKITYVYTFNTSILLLFRYHRGQPIFVVGEHKKSFEAIITSIGNETVSFQ